MSQFKLKRINGPLLERRPENAWESRAVLNPAAIRDGENVHLLYRAVEGENFSTIAYARMDASGKVLQRDDQPVILRELEIEQHGCEDPRVVLLDGTYYVFYTGYDGQKYRICLAATRDFRRYQKFGIIGPDQPDKDAFIFPEKIDGKVAFMHRIAPNIQLAWFDDMEHLRHPEPDYWPRHLKDIQAHTVMGREFAWERRKIGGGPPPLRTEAGWLLIYHGVDEKFTYRAGAALLDAKNPLKVIARLPYPILEPEREYEQIGDVNFVVFPEGAVLFGDELQIYYGGADKVVGLAIGKLSHLVDELWKHR